MEWAWLIPVFSFAAAPLIVVFGPYLPGKGAFLSILAIAAGFVLFWVVFASFLTVDPVTAEECAIGQQTGAVTCNYERTWFNAGLAGAADSVQLTWGIIVDPLTVAMLGLVTFVALMVQIYSLGYMHGDSRFGWYYAVHALFAASMLTLVLADNFLLLYVALGAGGRLLLPAHRVLVRAELGGQGGGQEGLRHHPHRRRGAAGGHPAPVQSRSGLVQTCPPPSRPPAAGAVGQRAP